MKKTTSLLLTMVLLLVVCTSQATSQEFLDDRDAWLEAICNEPIPDDFESFQGGPGLFDIGSPATFAWGEIAVPDSTTGVNAFVDSGDTLIFTSPLDGRLVITPDSANGPLEGFCIQYSSDDNNTTTIDLFDGTTLVDTLTLPPNPQSDGSGNIFYCWRNDTGLNITSLEYTTTTLAGIYSSEFAFGSCDEPTNREKLDNIIVQLQELLASGSASNSDQSWIEWAICDLIDAQNPAYFATDDRLSDQGTCFFSRVFWATYALECVAEEDLVNEALIAIDDMLACFVEAEIDFAMENPDVNTNMIAYAEFFENYAEEFAGVELFIQSVILHFYAWWFANNA